MKRQKRINLIYLFLITVLFSMGCDKDGDSNSPLAESQIIISPDNIMMNDDETGMFSISINLQVNFNGI